MTYTEWTKWYARMSAYPPVPVRCRICGEQYLSDQTHTCVIAVEERIVNAVRAKREVRFKEQDDIKKVISFFTQRCWRSLNIPRRVDEIMGRSHYDRGYIWSYRVDWKWTPFTVFEEK